MAFLVLISLFLPVVTVSGYRDSESFSYFSDEFDQSDRPFFLVLMLIVIALGVVSIVLKKKWARITTAIIGILSGLMVSIGVFLVRDEISKWSTVASVGSGAVLLTLFSVLLIVACVVTLIPH